MAYCTTGPGLRHSVETSLMWLGCVPSKRVHWPTADMPLSGNTMVRLHFAPWIGAINGFWTCDKWYRKDLFVHEDDWESTPACQDVGESKTVQELWNSTKTGTCMHVPVNDIFAGIFFFYYYFLSHMYHTIRSAHTWFTGQSSSFTSANKDSLRSLRLVQPGCWSNDQHTVLCTLIFILLVFNSNEKITAEDTVRRCIYNCYY